MNNDMHYLHTLFETTPRSFADLGYDDLVGSDSLVKRIIDDSRDIQQGDTFLCMPRASEQAKIFIQSAIDAGAANIIYIGNNYISSSAPCLAVKNMHEAGTLLRRFYNTQDTATTCIGITGTDGKTSVTWMLREALQRKLGKAWSCGTLGWVRDESHTMDLGNTTPSLLTLHQLLAAAAAQHIPALVMEVSSHGIEQQRIAGLPIHVAVWTTLGHDHLQDHGGFDAYAAIKKRFIQAAGKQGASVIYNASQPNIVTLLEDKQGYLSYGHGLYQDVSMTSSTPSADASHMAWEQELPGLIRLSCRGQEVVADDIPVGEFHAENIAAVAQILHGHFDISMTEIVSLLQGMTAPPGRMQAVASGCWQVYIDYAHTPEALQACLQSARKLTSGRLLLAFGCGGERDREKRPEMGRVAAEFADVIWITSDNPRNERAELIASEIEDGISHPYSLEVHLQLDREQAIAESIAALDKHDTLIIAGKGHEAYMDIAGSRLPWSDLACARSFLQQKNSQALVCA